MKNQHLSPNLSPNLSPAESLMKSSLFQKGDKSDKLEGSHTHERCVLEKTYIYPAAGNLNCLSLVTGMAETQRRRGFEAVTRLVTACHLLSPACKAWSKERIEVACD